MKEPRTPPPAHQPQDARGRFVCSAAHPFQLDFTGAWAHPDSQPARALSYANGTPAHLYKCSACGRVFIVADETTKGAKC